MSNKRYVKRTVMIEFANSKIKAEDEIDYITLAAVNTIVRLREHYDVRLSQPFITNSGLVMINMWIPKDLNENGFSSGNHLKSISTYLLMNYKDRYYKYRVGTRLLNYIDTYTKNNQIESDLGMAKLHIISDFVNFIECATVEEVECTRALLDDFIYGGGSYL